MQDIKPDQNSKWYIKKINSFKNRTQWWIIFCVYFICSLSMCVKENVSLCVFVLVNVLCKRVLCDYTCCVCMSRLSVCVICVYMWIWVCVVCMCCECVCMLCMCFMLVYVWVATIVLSMTKTLFNYIKPFTCDRFERIPVSKRCSFMISWSCFLSCKTYNHLYILHNYILIYIT